jgi:hypothetical protein
MNKLIAATLGLALIASSASAQNRSLKGSDTLFEMTQEMFDLCQIQPGNMIYVGGGSGGGEDALKAQQQQVAPMSRFLNAAACGSTGVLSHGQGYVAALDAIGVLSDDTEATTCNTLRYQGSMPVAASANGNTTVECPGCTDSDADGVLDTYNFSEWQQVLRIVYVGRHNAVNANECVENAPGVPAGETADCNSDVRNTLVNNWSSLFEAGCTDPECSALKHAFRRDDISGTTDTFLNLLSLPGIATNPFCNGTEFEDKDPIRRACDGNGQSTAGENVCRRTNFAKDAGNTTPTSPDFGAVTSANAPTTSSRGDLGLVLPIVMPTAAGDQFTNSNTCASLGFGGQFRYAPMPLSLLPAASQLCPNGTQRAFNGCLWPVDSTGAYGCVNPATNRPVGVTGFANVMDGRVYNLTPRRIDGTIPTVSRKQGSTTVNRPMLNVGFYRIHQRTIQANASGSACVQPDATEQIGCLVHASPCSIGYAGLTADLQNPNKLLALRTPLSHTAGGGPVTPDDDQIRRLLQTCTGGGQFATRYPLSRKLFLNTLLGFNTVTDNPGSTVTQEAQLARCWADRRFSDRAALAAGFVTLDTANCATQTLPDPNLPNLNTPTECNLADDTPAYEIKACADAP